MTKVTETFTEDRCGLSLVAHDGDTVDFIASGDVILERSVDMRKWSQSESCVHAGESMAYRMRGTKGTCTLTVGA